MENPIERRPNNNEILLRMLKEIASDYNETREVKTEKTGFGHFVIDRNLISSVARNLSSSELRDMVRSIDPNSTMRKVGVLIEANMNVGTALFAEAAVVVSAYILGKNSSEENLNRFTDAVLKLAEIKQG